MQRKYKTCVGVCVYVDDDHLTVPHVPDTTDHVRQPRTKNNIRFERMHESIFTSQCLPLRYWYRDIGPPKTSFALVFVL